MVDGFKVYVEAINIFSHNNKIPVKKKKKKKKKITEKEGGGGGGGVNSIAPTFGRYCFSVRNHNHS